MAVLDHFFAVTAVDRNRRCHDSGMRDAIGSSSAALGDISTAARSKIAYQLEKQAILLALEEGKAV